LVANDVSCRQHAFVQDAGNQNASRLTSVKHNVLTVLHATKVGPNVVAGTARSWVVGQYLATGFKII